MNDDEWLSAEFDAFRPRLRAVAYRMLGSHSEADDAVQETWLRLARTDVDGVHNLAGWLTTVTSRVCLDRLRSRRAHPEQPIDTPAHDAVVASGDAHDPADAAELADSISAALLVVLDLLPPAERVAFVLHDVFAVPFDEVAEILDKSPDATRQLASRARRRLHDVEPVSSLDLVAHRRIVDAFLRAARGGDFEALVNLLDPEVVLRPDAAAVAMGSLREMHGANAVAGALAGGAQGARVAVVDGVAALVWAPGGQIRGVIEFEVSGELIVAIRVMGDAARIAAREVVLLDQ